MTEMASKITGVKWRHHVQCITGYTFDRNPCYVRMMWVRMFLYTCMRVSVGQIYRSPTPGLLFNRHKCYLIIPRGQIAAISQTTCSNAFLWMKKKCILIQISLKILLKGPIDNKSAWVQAIYWRQKGDKPLPESNADPVPWRIYATRGGYALIDCFYDLRSAVSTATYMSLMRLHLS